MPMCHPERVYHRGCCQTRVGAADGSGERDDSESLLSDDEGNGVIVSVGKAHSPLRQPEFLTTLGGATVEPDQRLAPMIADDLRLMPGDALRGHHAHAYTEGLGDSLLGGESGGELRGTAAGIENLGRGEDALQEAVAVSLQHAFDSGDSDQVNAAGEHRRAPY